MEIEGIPQDQDSLFAFVFPTSLTFYAKESNSHKQIVTLYNPYNFIFAFDVLSTSPGNYIVTPSRGLVKPQCCIDIEIHRFTLNGMGGNGRSSSIEKMFRNGNCDVVGGDGNGSGVIKEKFRFLVRRRDTPQQVGRVEMTTECYIDRQHRDRLTIPRQEPRLRFFASASSASMAAQLASSCDKIRRNDAAVALSKQNDDVRTTGRRGSVLTAICRRCDEWERRRRSNNPPLFSGWLLSIVAALCILCLSLSDPRGELAKLVTLPEWFSPSINQKLIAAFVLGLITAAVLIKR